MKYSYDASVYYTFYIPSTVYMCLSLLSVRMDRCTIIYMLSVSVLGWVPIIYECVCVCVCVCLSG